MHINTIYALLRRAVKEQLVGGLAPYQPGPDEDLEALYGFDITVRRGFYDIINKVFEKNGTPIKPKLTTNDTADKKTLRKLRTLIKLILFFIYPFTFVSGLSLSGIESKAYAEIHLETYNTDYDKKNLSNQELRVYLSHKMNPMIAKVDKNSNGKIDAAELDNFNNSVDEMVNEEMAAFFTRNDGPVDAPIESVPLESALEILNQEPFSPKSAEDMAKEKQLAELEARRTYTDEVKWYLRKKGSDVSIRADRFDGNAATISFNNDGEEGVANGRITAAVGLLQEVRIKRDKAPQDGSYVGAFTYGGALSIDRAFDSRGSSFEKFNSLQLRAGGELEIANLFFPVQYLSGWTYFDTDTDFGKRVLGGEIAYEPFHADFLRGFSFANGRIIARIAPELRANYESVLADPSDAYPYDEALLAGYGITAGISYITDRKIASFTSHFIDGWNVLGEDERVYHWTNSLDFFLNKEENFTLTASHDYEVNDLISEQINSFELGLGVRF